jgi:hypothetical protein
VNGVYVVGFRCSASGGSGVRLRGAGCGLHVAGCGLRGAGCALRVADCEVRVARCGYNSSSFSYSSSTQYRILLHRFNFFEDEGENEYEPE